LLPSLEETDWTFQTTGLPLSPKGGVSYNGEPWHLEEKSFFFPGFPVPPPYLPEKVFLGSSYFPLFFSPYHSPSSRNDYSFFSKLFIPPFPFWSKSLDNSPFFFRGLKFFFFPILFLTGVFFFFLMDGIFLTFVVLVFPFFFSPKPPL